MIIVGDVLVYDVRPLLSLEDVFRSRAAFAGILDTEFDSLASEDMTTDSNWIDVENVWNIFNGSAVADASGVSSSYAVLWHVNQTPASYKITAELPGMTPGDDGYAIIVRGDGAGNYYAVDFDYYGADVVYCRPGWPPLALTRIEPGEVFNTDSIVEVGVFQQQFSDYEAERYLFIAVLVNGRLVTVAKDRIPDSEPGRYWGLAAATGETVEWGPVRIADLCDIIEWTSHDPGETTQAALDRSIGDRTISQFVRANSALRAWRPKATDPVYTFDDSLELRYSISYDTRELITHVRMQYASGWVEAYDPELYHKYGHRFEEIYNADIYTKPEAYAEALAVLRRSKEQAQRCTLTVVNAGYLLEVGDHFVAPDGQHYIVDSVQFDVGLGVQTTIEGRRYAFT